MNSNTEKETHLPEISKPLLWSGWFDAKTNFPPFDKKVLGFFTIPESNKKDSKLLEYYQVVLCESVTESANGKSGFWRDEDYTPVEPLFWCEFPKSPLTK